MNYQKELDKKLLEIEKLDKKPGLLLHGCCGPCSSYVLEYLSRYFDITLYFYNPNISTKAEYDKRAAEVKRLLESMPEAKDVKLMVADYNPDEFYEIAKGLEQVPEGGERCFRCYRLRLDSAANVARMQGFDYFTTTLSISPHKNAEKLNEIGLELEKEYEVTYLVSDFKKRNGFKRSIELSSQYDLYRQDFCGCVYSKKAKGPEE